ncbi:MAG: hypothetical protein H8E46_01630 [FCB group bacterium]|nr:hypothetical protein [FCB group bacterium]
MKGRRLFLICFSLGLILEISAFLLDKADFFDFVYFIISPTYLDASSALDKLIKVEEINIADKGFDVISGIIIEDLRKINSEENIKRISIIRMSLGGASMKFSKDKVGEYRPLYFSLSNGQKSEVNYNTIKDRIQELKNARIIEYSLIIFILGVCLQIIGYLLINKGTS